MNKVFFFFTQFNGRLLRTERAECVSFDKMRMKFVTYRRPKNFSIHNGGIKISETIPD